jgi:hypothetical protein
MKKTNKTKYVPAIIHLINILKTYNIIFNKIDELLSLILIKKGILH